VSVSSTWVGRNDARCKETVVFILVKGGGVGYELERSNRKMEPTLSSETSAYNNILAPGKFPEDYTLYSHHGESLKTRIRECLILANF
jgi:hypothetical protein